MNDLFLSYSSIDRAFASDLAKSLTGLGVRVWFDEWELNPGDSLLSKISDGIKTSAYLLVVLSAASVSSRWVRTELEQAMIEEITTGRVKVVPIIRERCDIPEFIKAKVYVDLSTSSDYRYGVQKIVDLVFARSPSHSERPALAQELIDEYESLLMSPRPDTSRVAILTHDMLRVLSSLAMTPDHNADESYYRLKTRMAELNLLGGDLYNALDGYECAYERALESQKPNHLIRAGITRGCLLAYLRRPDDACAAFASVLDALAEQLSEERSVNAPVLLEFLVDIVFCRQMQVRNPLALVYHGDYHILNLRLGLATDAFFGALKAFVDDSEGLFLPYGEMLERLGILRGALKYYAFASTAGMEEAREALDRLEAAQDAAAAMARYYLKGAEPPDRQTRSLETWSPEALGRILMCNGTYVDRDDLAIMFPENDMDENHDADYLTDYSSVEVLVYEDTSGSAASLAQQLRRAGLGLMIVRSQEDARLVLERSADVKLYVSDHHMATDSVFENISGYLFDRDVLKPNFPTVRSVLLIDDPQDGLINAFLGWGGAAVVECRGKSDDEIAEAIGELLANG